MRECVDACIRNCCSAHDDVALAAKRHLVRVKMCPEKSILEELQRLHHEPPGHPGPFRVQTVERFG